jgi:hypothetical protein
MKTTKIPLEKQIEIAVQSIRVGVAEQYVFLCLMNDGISETRARTIVRWAKQSYWDSVDSDAYSPYGE